jgi:dTDP-4-amino-4,6-dideoxygalactose transaminase
MSKLAMFGGPPVLPEGVVLEGKWPPVTDEALAAVQRVFRTGSFVGIHDPEVEALEEEYARFVGMDYAVALGSGTAALHAAVVAAGCEPGDEVLVPALTFLASATAILHHLCIPVFVDIDPVTYNLDPASVEAAISPRTRAIMAVDLHGLPADYDALSAIARRHNLKIIEDAAHATGAEYKGRRAGGLGDVAGTSIMPGKQLPACGEGGLFSTSDAEAQNRASMIRMFGEVIRKDQPRAYNAYTLGWNYRLNPIQAAFTRIQLARISEYSARYAETGAHLSAALRDLPGLLPPHVPDGSTHVYHMFRIRFDPAAAGLDIHAGRFAQAVQDAMAAEGLPFRHYQNVPVPGQAIFQLKQGFGKGLPWTLPGARDVSYDIEAFPVALEVIENTRCIGKAGSSGPNYFGSRTALEYYLEGFRKLWDELPAIAEYAESMDYQAPWQGVQVPSTRGEWTVLSPDAA